TRRAGTVALPRALLLGRQVPSAIAAGMVGLARRLVLIPIQLGADPDRGPTGPDHSLNQVLQLRLQSTLVLILKLDLVLRAGRAVSAAAQQLALGVVNGDVLRLQPLHCR